MYLIALEGQPWYDTVYWTATSRALRAGDFVITNQGECLAIGDEIAFPELYIPQRLPQLHDVQQRIPAFLDERTRDIIHWLAHTYYAAYKHVIALYPIKSPARQRKTAPTYASMPPQHCILYPDLRSLTQLMPTELQQQAAQKNSTIAILHGGLTVTQKRTIYDRVRNGEITRLYATSRGLFLPWNHLTQITIHTPQARAYSNQSEPRFSVLHVAEKFCEIYDAKLILC